MLRSPPPQPGAPGIMPRTFLRRSDPCFEQLRSHDQAIEDLMKYDKLIPGVLNAISNLVSPSNSSLPASAHPAPNPSPGGGGGGGGGGGNGARGQGKGKGKKGKHAAGQWIAQDR